MRARRVGHALVSATVAGAESVRKAKLTPERTSVGPGGLPGPIAEIGPRKTASSRIWTRFVEVTQDPAGVGADEEFSIPSHKRKSSDHLGGRHPDGSIGGLDPKDRRYATIRPAYSRRLSCRLRPPQDNECSSETRASFRQIRSQSTLWCDRPDSSVLTCVSHSAECNQVRVRRTRTRSRVTAKS